jgi:antirestriction protein ArdC
MSKRTKQPCQDIYQKVTDQILQALENGVRPWANNRWHCAQQFPLRATGEPYKGINIVILWCAQMERGYRCNTWMTFKQAKALGANVRKNERGQCVVFTSKMEKENDAGDKVAIPFLRQYTVFNLEQLENLPEDYSVLADDLPRETDNPDTPNDCDALLYRTGANIQHGGDTACFIPSRDTVQLPRFSDFTSADAYTATLSHELVHWSGGENRLDRGFDDDDTQRAYAREELVAELGAAFLCAGFGVGAEIRDDHAGYLASWLQLLRDDKHAILRAAAAAQKAADFVMTLTEPVNAESDATVAEAA